VLPILEGLGGNAQQVWMVAVPQTWLASSHPRALAPAISLAGKALSVDVRMAVNSSHSLQRSVPDHLLQVMASTPCTHALLVLLLSSPPATLGWAL
jgi:hypothetical protein